MSVFVKNIYHLLGPSSTIMTAQNENEPSLCSLALISSTLPPTPFTMTIWRSRLPGMPSTQGPRNTIPTMVYVMESNISSLFMDYRCDIIKKAKQQQQLIMIECLTLNYILLINTDKPYQPTYQDQQMQRVGWIWIKSPT